MRREREIDRETERERERERERGKGGDGDAKNEELKTQGLAVITSCTGFLPNRSRKQRERRERRSNFRHTSRLTD